MLEWASARKQGRAEHGNFVQDRRAMSKLRHRGASPPGKHQELMTSSYALACAQHSMATYMTDMNTGQAQASAMWLQAHMGTCAWNSECFNSHDLCRSHQLPTLGGRHWSTPAAAAVHSMWSNTFAGHSTKDEQSPLCHHAASPPSQPRKPRPSGS